MKKFEIGKRYTDGAMTFEIIGRTAKTAKVATIQHAGRFNEKVTDIKNRKINNWDTEEVIYCGCYELHAQS